MMVEAPLNLSQQDLDAPWFGLVVQGIDNEVAEALGIEVDDGVMVFSVEKGSAAARAGIRPGDVLQAVGRKKVASIGDFRQARGLMDAFDELEVLVLRNKRKYVVELKGRDQKATIEE